MANRGKKCKASTAHWRHSTSRRRFIRPRGVETNPVNLLQVYNDYRSLCGGEATVVKMTAALVEKHGGTARLLTRTSKGLDQSIVSKVRGFASGIYSRAACREMASE